VKRQHLTTAILAAAFSVVAGTAHAQAAGGGGGLIQPIITWFMTNIGQGLIMIGVVVVGGMMIAGRHTLAGVAVMVIGALIFANYQTIAALIPIGG
jgi:type IV secretory pathway VirB2 component (pilin)